VVRINYVHEHAKKLARKEKRGVTVNARASS